MAKNILAKDSRKYSGKYVATRSFKNKEVVSSGTNPEKVFLAAKSKGVRDPVLVYIPKRGQVNIY